MANLRYSQNGYEQSIADMKVVVKEDDKLKEMNVFSKSAFSWIVL